MNTISRLSILILISALLFGEAVSPAAAQPAGGDFSTVDDYIIETMRRLPIAGLSLAVVQGDQILYLKGYGSADPLGTPVTPQTPFMLASVTKSFTALAVRQLAAAGKLDLNSPLQTYLPEFRMADPQAAAAVTVRHLLDHTSGISTLEGTEPYLHSPETTFAEALSHLARYTPKHGLGHSEYSNWNFVLLGEVIARVSGQPYADYMQTHVLDPLQMTRASFADYHTLPGTATGHYISFGFRIPYDEKHIPVMTSAGYLTASAEEMAHYLIPFFNRGQYQGVDLLPAQGQGWYDPSWNWQPGIPPDVSTSFSGAHNSINTAIQIFPKHQLGVAVLMNTRLDTLVPAPTASEIAFNLARIVIGFPYELPSNRSFYGGYALYDGFLLAAGIAVVWQAAKLKGWGKRYQAVSSRRRMASWLGIALNLLVAAGILSLPALQNTRWHIVLYHRPDMSRAFLAVSLLLIALAIVKIGWAARHHFSGSMR